MLLDTMQDELQQTNSSHNKQDKSKDGEISQSRESEGGENRNSSQRDKDLTHESSVDDAGEIQSKERDEPASKRQRLGADGAVEPVVTRAADSTRNQPLDGLSVEAQQALLRHLLNNGNHIHVPSAQELANAEISAQLQTLLIQQQLLLSGAYFPHQLGAAAHFSQNGSIDAVARLASLSGAGLGYPSASLLASFNPMQMLQQVNSRITDSSGSSLSAGGLLGNFTQSNLPAFTQQLTGRPAVPLSIESDEKTLSEFQRLVRKHIELFEAKQEDVESNAQGRNRPIVLGQVGIRCCHCAHLPPKLRCRGSTYYPTTLQGLYQAAQNMATGHLCNRCSHIPVELREELVRLKECKSSAGGGKTYWGDGVRSLGVYEAPTGLRFHPLS